MKLHSADRWRDDKIGFKARDPRNPYGPQGPKAPSPCVSSAAVMSSGMAVYLNNPIPLFRAAIGKKDGHPHVAQQRALRLGIVGG